MRRDNGQGGGCVFDGHHGQYIYGMIVELARGEGYVPSVEYDREVAATVAYAEGVSALEVVIEEAEKAEKWLNGHVAEEGFLFGWEDGEFFYQPAAWWQDDEIDEYNDISNDNEEETT